MNQYERIRCAGEFAKVGRNRVLLVFCELVYSLC